jgi:hypothetical protein
VAWRKFLREPPVNTAPTDCRALQANAYHLAVPQLTATPAPKCAGTRLAGLRGNITMDVFDLAFSFWREVDTQELSHSVG